MSSEPVAPSTYPQPSKPHWTAGKIIALVLVVLVVVSAAAAAGVYYYLNRPVANGVSSICSNGATNYPSCNTCSSGQSFVNGTCYNNCTNGATNPPACSNNVCSNGATNYPTCTVFQTTTTVTCDPSTVHVNLTQSSCTVTVSDTTIPTGTVGLSCTARPGYTHGDCSSTNPTCSLSGVSSTSATCILSVTATGPEASEIIYANYQGDNTHLSSSGQFTLTVTPPPTTVTVTGTASVYGTATAKSIEFVDSQTGVSYLALINSGTYTINLANFRTYNVIINWTILGIGGSTTCPSPLQLRSYSDTWYANYQC